MQAMEPSRAKPPSQHNLFANGLEPYNKHSP